MIIRILLSGLGGLWFAGNVIAGEFFVSPQGSDTDPGTREKPFATLEKAREAIRTDRLTREGSLPGQKVKETVAKKTDDMANRTDQEKKPATDGPKVEIRHEAYTVNLRGGEYRLKETFVLSAQDSGYWNAPVVWRSAPGEQAVLSGATDVSGWKKLADAVPGVTTNAQGKLFVADIKKGWRFHCLFVDGNSQNVAEWPSEVQRKSIRNHIETIKVGMPGTNGWAVEFKPGILDGLATNGDVEFRMFPQWYFSSYPVLRGIDGNTATMHSRSVILKPTAPFKTSDKVSTVIRNALKALDEPGEWCVDSAAGRVYYWPPDGVMDGKKVVVPELYTLVRIEGEGEAQNWQNPISFVEFRDLTFRYTDWMHEDVWPKDWLCRHFAPAQGMLHVRNAADCVIDGCSLLDAGASGLLMDHYVQRVRVTRNHIGRVGGSAIMMNGYGPGLTDVNKWNVIRRNFIHDVGQTSYSGAGVMIYGSGCNDISLNWFDRIAMWTVMVAGTGAHDWNNESWRLVDLFGEWKSQYQAREKELPEKVPNQAVMSLFTHSGNNRIQHNVLNGYMQKMTDAAGLDSWCCGYDNQFVENVMKDGRFIDIYLDTGTPDARVEGNRAWSRSRRWHDNSSMHNKGQSWSRKVTDSGFGNDPAPSQNGSSTIIWRNNKSTYPDKPEGWDALLDRIVAAAKEDGGWPTGVDEAKLAEFQSVKP
jgi:hypothetical protein